MFQVIRSLVPDCQNHEDIVDKHAGEQVDKEILFLILPLLFVSHKI